MELFLLLIPAVFLPITLSVIGIWWLLSEGNSDRDESMDDDGFDGDI
ncbi:MAG: hypothetical protein P8Y12_07895 [Gammaproteobacteria bacterium]|jgi:hypothetical protein